MPLQLEIYKRVKRLRYIGCPERRGVSQEGSVNNHVVLPGQHTKTNKSCSSTDCDVRFHTAIVGNAGRDSSHLRESLGKGMSARP